MKLLLDTDIGSDIDDAICLAYLLAQPACKLLGVTTVTGAASARARMASALCRLAGHDIPIHPGAEHPLLIPQRQPEAPQAGALETWPHASEFAAGEAVTFLRDTIRAHPGEVTLLAIGPMTNVALLFATYPETAGLLKGLRLMCGAFGTGRAPVTHPEWNARVDPHAAAVVYRTPVRVHRSVGLDVTMQVQLSADEVRRRFTHPLLRPVRDFAEVWFKQRPLITFHDPLAAVALFDESLVTFERGTAAVELTDDANAGQTHWSAAGSGPHDVGPHEVGSGVDAERFFDRLFAVLPMTA